MRICACAQLMIRIFFQYVHMSVLSIIKFTALLKGILNLQKILEDILYIKINRNGSTLNWTNIQYLRKYKSLWNNLYYCCFDHSYTSHKKRTAPDCRNFTKPDKIIDMDIRNLVYSWQFSRLDISHLFIRIPINKSNYPKNMKN